MAGKTIIKPAPTSATVVLLKRSLMMNAYEMTNPATAKYTWIVVAVIAAAPSDVRSLFQHLGQEARCGDYPVHFAVFDHSHQRAVHARHDRRHFDDGVIGVDDRYLLRLSG